MDNMDLITVATIAVGLLIIVFGGGGIIAFFAFAVPAMKTAPPLTAADRESCGRVIREHKAYPFLCRHSVKKGACPCQPCSKLEAARPR